MSLCKILSLARKNTALKCLKNNSLTKSLLFKSNTLPISSLPVLTKRFYADETFDNLFGADFEQTYNSSYRNRFDNRSNYNQPRRGLFEDFKPDGEPVEYREIKKDFYDEVLLSQTEASDEEIKDYFKTNSIDMNSNNFEVSPIMNFSQLKLPDDLAHKFERLNFDKPTPIQSITLPITLSGKDLVGIAQTGSGKTLSFLLPAFIHMQGQEDNNSRGNPKALVVVPTRELANQCMQVYQKISPGNSRCVAVYGGASKATQINALRRGCDLVVATPGRLLDLVTSFELSLDNVSYLVLDEADRMLDMGFEKDITNIVQRIRPDRQFTMWSATWPKEVQKLASSFLTLKGADASNHVQVTIGSNELNASKTIAQKFNLIASRVKMNKFVELAQQLKHQNEGKMIVFCNTKRMCDNLQNILRRNSIHAGAIHGDKSQQQRDQVLKDFKRRDNSILIATDVAARGIDVSNIAHVINFDMSLNCVDYIHRIGRTGRAGKKGNSWTFITENDGAVIDDLIDSLENIDHEVDDKLRQMQQWNRENKRNTKASKNRGYGQGGRYNRRDNYSRGGYNQGGYNNRPSNRYNNDRYNRNDNRYNSSRGRNYDNDDYYNDDYYK